MIKAVKKLKLWSRKKRKRKTHPPPPYDPPPPPLPPRQSHYRCSCTASASIQPSAPPLPPWMDFTEHDEEIEILLTSELRHPFPEPPYRLPTPSHRESADWTVNSDTSPRFKPTSSYQQYMVPDPVYGIPVAQATTETRERSAGFFRCVVNIGIHMFRCFTPCFRIREFK